MDNTLLGKWKIDPDDVYSLEWYGDIMYEFLDNGTLVHTIQNLDRVQTINLKYAVQAEALVITRPHADEDEHVRFVFLADGKLELHVNNVASRFVRE